MSQILTLELSDRAFTAIRQNAEAAGIPPEHLVAAMLEQRFGQVFKSLLTEAAQEEARARFERHFGTLDLGYTAEVDQENLDNENIDADLAREYANTHEEE
jgi:predicted lipid carrier protein YhbT